ncbi:MAG: hypothetical protein KDD70_16515, partial [Bdellovibrionales bacterium]|nr:hypothetical protein [Bdellovibrionales bacterium]
MVGEAKQFTLWLGRHETRRSGLWVYIENVLGPLVETLLHGGHSIRIIGAGSVELQEIVRELLRDKRSRVEFQWLKDPFGSRYLGSLRDLFFLGNYKGTFHGMSNTVPLVGGGEQNVLTVHDLLQAYPAYSSTGLYAA